MTYTAVSALARAQMGPTQLQLCFILGIWARFGIIYFSNNIAYYWHQAEEQTSHDNQQTRSSATFPARWSEYKARQ